MKLKGLLYGSDLGFDGVVQGQATNPLLYREYRGWHSALLRLRLCNPEQPSTIWAF